MLMCSLRASLAFLLPPLILLPLPLLPPQDFEWNLKRSGSGVRPSVNVVSTFDSRYTDASLSGRVAAGDVGVARLGDAEVELRIGEARPSDGGVYSCHTPSTDSVIRGTYKADVELTGEANEEGR